MKINFHGLIAHVKVDNRDISRAILIKAPNHLPILSVSENDIVGTPTFPRLFGTKSGQALFNLSGQQVTLNGLPLGPTRRTTQFDENVPSLFKVLKFEQNPKKLDDDVHGDRLHSHATTYINLTGGYLDAGTCFDAQALWDQMPDDPLCVAELAIYDSDSDFPDTVELIGNNNRKVEVNRTAIVDIYNLSGSGGIHFHMFQRLAANATGIRDLRRNPDEICVDCRPVKTSSVVILGADLECTNSHWP
jgi:hypothetical protein